MLTGNLTFTARTRLLPCIIGRAYLRPIITVPEWNANGKNAAKQDIHCLVTDEAIGLLLDTTAAHHFNFVLPDMDQGEYEIKAFFTTGARAEVDICDSALD